MNGLAHRRVLQPGADLYGKAFEGWVYHELSACDAYSEVYAGLSYWRLTSGVEVDFIVGDMQVAIEAKATARVTSDHLKGLRQLLQEQPQLSSRLVVCLEPRARRTEDGIWILPATEFAARLCAGEVF